MAVLVSTATMNAQTVKKTTKEAISKVQSNPLESQILSSKNKIDQERERIVKANTVLLNDSKKRIAAAEAKYKKATYLFEKEKNEYKTTITKEKASIKFLTSEIKKYK